MQDTKGGCVSTGGYIYQLFERDNGQTSVMVNRGWLPKADMEKHMADNKSKLNGGTTDTIVGLMVQGEEVRYPIDPTQ
jgi:cytochrome oxidase assembly protein ShyY1